jgi:hypothetical protein
LRGHCGERRRGKGDPARACRKRRFVREVGSHRAAVRQPGFNDHNFRAYVSTAIEVYRASSAAKEKQLYGSASAA